MRQHFRISLFKTETHQGKQDGIDLRAKMVTELLLKDAPNIPYRDRSALAATQP
jgi:hypothetical protein